MMLLTHSEAINEIGAALAKAQGEIEGAPKDKSNPFFKSKYADLNSVWHACRAPLSKNGIAVVQVPSTEGNRVTVETLLIHGSGQWICGSLVATSKDEGPQSIGSAITYLRRYMLQSFAGVAAEDDDGEQAEGRQTQPQHQPAPKTNGKPKEQPATTLNPASLFKAFIDETVKTEGRLWGVNADAAREAIIDHASAAVSMTPAQLRDRRDPQTFNAAMDAVKQKTKELAEAAEVFG